MVELEKSIIEQFGNKLRVRVCGLCIENDKLLLVNHHALNDSGIFWGPPGGGMDYASNAVDNLKREFLEETGIQIEIIKFLFVHEYLSPPLHAIELFFLVKRIDGKVKIGYDPELSQDSQIIKDVGFIKYDELKKMNSDNIHQVFENFKSLQELKNAEGYFIKKS